eukprot:TRINITY_DN31345_c0_g1_i2.p3 TRINITY_DN31345_c0_g1~~TRINITY_DN31345_c0_g1_i2.p3  ORF type:complete len:127 (-),score=10.94 TRINITY_DN31345_c0_g1_i2:7-387(-)
MVIKKTLPMHPIGCMDFYLPSKAEISPQYDSFNNKLLPEHALAWRGPILYTPETQIAIKQKAKANWMQYVLNRAIQIAQGIAPVSYTHLRAHETSLHLVCRLLLEKKKITNNYKPEDDNKQSDLSK